MKPVLFKNIIRTIIYYWKDAVYQVIIIAILSAIISGSLFTGYSVRTSLKLNAREKLGNTDIILSSGIRYLDPTIAGKIKAKTGDNAAPILEADGFCQNFNTGATALNIKIYGVNHDFFVFQGNDSIFIEPGTVAINIQLAELLGINKGDELILYLSETDPIPANAPFAPGTTGRSKVLKVGRILPTAESGDFSLAISQLAPVNAFINLDEAGTEINIAQKVNRILINNDSGNSEASYLNIINDLLSPSDIGFSIRESDKTGEPELISDRIFIDSVIVKEVLHVYPDASPVLTYLANSIAKGSNSTPYSFVSALPSSLYPGIDTGEVVVSKWLADDLNCNPGDTLDLTWYYQSQGNRLEEASKSFIISEIISDDNDYADPSLMPEFPGISGSTSCSDWDAGVPILLDKIRKEDEEYWNLKKGTPKALISYDAGQKIWGNEYGIATAIRFPRSIELSNIQKKLTGNINPSLAGITISEIAGKADVAASSGVDFSTLFISLSFFIILAGIILLIMAISIFLNSRKSQVRTLHALGYRNRTIRRILITETLVIAFAGAVLGSAAGYFLNYLLISALNTVWRGAVQTNMLSPQFSFSPMITGLGATLMITFLIALFKTNSFLRSLKSSFLAGFTSYRRIPNILILGTSLIIAFTLFIFSFINRESSTLLSFAGGSLFFISGILFFRYLLVSKLWNPGSLNSMRHYSQKFYSINPSNATTPVIFIAAGIFAVIIAGSNRQVISSKMLLPSGGTGGYLLWAESAIPVRENLNLEEGRTEFGLDEDEIADISFVQARRLKGDDASCLNLNHVTTPPILGLDPGPFRHKGSFSFASKMKGLKDVNPWEVINSPSSNNTIYGIADQTVLEWGLKVKPGDTLKFNAENGQSLNIVICAGLKSSVFQGYLLISEKNFSSFFPSVSGYSVFLAEGNAAKSDYYQSLLSDRISMYGFYVEPASDKLSSFFQVSNTYLDVFTLLGAFGMILGVAGLGFILLRNFNLRKREFALMLASGFRMKSIRQTLINDELIIMFWGIVTGSVSALTATLPSLSSGISFPVTTILIMLILISAAGLSAILLVIRGIKQNNLVSQLRLE
jgi:putative ABC transport system permease protein